MAVRAGPWLVAHGHCYPIRCFSTGAITPGWFQPSPRAVHLLICCVAPCLMYNFLGRVRPKCCEYQRQQLLGIHFILLTMCKYADVDQASSVKTK